MLDLLIIGAGFSGLSLGGCRASGRARAGLRWRMLEAEAQLGGTWHVNRYPSACCDIPSDLYSLAACPNPLWTRRYPSQAEIEAYLNRCADAVALRSQIQFNACAARAAWSAADSCWQVQLTDATNTALGDTARRPRRGAGSARNLCAPAVVAEARALCSLSTAGVARNCLCARTWAGQHRAPPAGARALQPASSATLGKNCVEPGRLPQLVPLCGRAQPHAVARFQLSLSAPTFKRRLARV